MATLGTAALLNISANQREGMATLVLPLRRGMMSAGRSITVQNALLAPGNQRVQWYPLGASYSDGSYRYVRCVFPFESAVAVADPNYPYATTIEKTLTFTDDTTAGSTHAQHSAVSAALSTASLTLVVDGNTIVFNNLHQATEIDIESGGSTNSHVKTYRIRKRGTRGPLTPDWWAELIFEVPDDQRNLRFWFGFGNSRIASDSSPWWPDTDYQLGASVTLQVVGPDCVIRNELAVVPAKVQTGSAGSWDTTFTLIDPTDDRSVGNQNDRDRFPDGASKVYEGTLLFDDSAAGIEASTMTAERETPIMAISNDWGDYAVYGIFGHVPPRPTNTLIASDAQAHYRAHEQAYADAQWYGIESGGTAVTGGRDPWVRSRYGLSPEPSTQKHHADFGALKLWHLVRGKCADLRAAQISAYQEVSCRPQYFVEFDGTRIINENHKAKNATLWSNIFLVNGRPEIRFGVPQPFLYAEGLGKTTGAPAGPRENSDGTTVPAPGQQWTAFDFLGASVQSVVGYTLLSGDKWMVLNGIDQLVEIFMATLWEHSSTVQSASHWRVTRGLDAGFEYLSLAQLYMASGNSKILTRLAGHYADVMIEGATTTGGWAGIDATGPVKSLSSGVPNPASATPQVDPPRWSPHEDSVAVLGCYAASIALADDHPTESAGFLTIAKQIAESIAMYGWRNIPESGSLYQSAEAIAYDPNSLGSSGQGDPLCSISPFTGCNRVFAASRTLERRVPLLHLCCVGSRLEVGH